MELPITQSRQIRRLIRANGWQIHTETDTHFSFEDGPKTYFCSWQRQEGQNYWVTNHTGLLQILQELGI